jgi:hypothetical protein
MKKTALVLFILIAAVVCTAPLAAQNKIIEVENSFIMGYNLVNNNLGHAQRMGLNFTLSDAFSAGFLYQQAGTEYAAASFLVLKNAVTKQLDMNLLIGKSGANAAAAIQGSLDLLNNSVQGINTSLKVSTEYLIPNLAGAIENGIFGVSLVLGFGI